MQKTAAKNKTTISNLDLYGDLKKIKAIIADATNDAKDRAEDLLIEKWDGMKEKSMEMQENAANYVAERPLKAVGIAFAVGAVMGFLMRK